VASQLPDPAIHLVKKMDARVRRQVYAVCACLTALPAHDVERVAQIHRIKNN
jgi:hypothetical protein